MRARILVALMVLRQAGRALGGGRGIFEAAAFARRNRAPIRLINSIVALLAKKGYLAPVATRDGGYVLMRAPESIRIHALVEELLHEGGGHAELERALTVDTPLKEALARIDAGLGTGFGDLTLADMVAADAAGKPA